jgi:GTPase
MVLISKVTPGCVTKTFEAEIWTIDDTSKKVFLSYKPVLNINNIRQVARFKQMEEGVMNEKNKKTDNYIILSRNQRTKVTFEFEFTPEYISVDNHLLINDSLLKVYGIITKTF